MAGPERHPHPPLCNRRARGRNRKQTALPGTPRHRQALDDSTWESGGAKTPMDSPDRGQGPGILDVFSGKGGTTEMPRGGVPGETGDENGNAMYSLVHFL